MSEMQTVEGQLDEFAGEPADYDRDTGEVMQEPEGQEKPRRTRSDKGKPRSRHVDAFSTGQPAPGEERATVNLRHWAALKQTDPKYTKAFTRPNGFKGTAITPVWTEMRMSEHFGPCGVGWGMSKPEFQLQPIEGNGELLVFCTVRLWYVEDGKEASVWGVGGDKVIARGRDGLRTNDEAFKACYTDALSNAMKHIGVAADVHMGLFDDNKYVREMTEVFAPPATPGNGQHHEVREPRPEPEDFVAASSPGRLNAAAGDRAAAPEPKRQRQQSAHEPRGPSPEHIATVLRTAQQMKAAGRDAALAWYEDLLAEDKEILRVAKTRRQARELPS